ncbi:mCG148193, partial [Mus musculus]
MRSEVGCAHELPPFPLHICLPSHQCTHSCITTEESQRYLLVHKWSSGGPPSCTFCTPDHLLFSLSLESGKKKN